MLKRPTDSPAQDEAQFQVLQAIDANPSISQRELSKELGVSLGKVNYCLKGLIDRGWLKAKNFKNSRNKIAYAYVFTPKGLSAKAKITRRFLDRKVQQYVALKLEIEQLRKEVSEDER